MVHSIVGPLLPVTLVIVPGFVARKRGRFSHSDDLRISKLVLKWIFVALLLAGMAAMPCARLHDVRFVVATFTAIMGMYGLAPAIGWYRLAN